MNGIERDHLNAGEGQSRRRETRRALGTGGLAVLMGMGLTTLPAKAAAGKKRAKKKRKGDHHHVGDGTPPSIQKVAGTQFTVGDGTSKDGFALCPGASLAIAGGLTQTNTMCFLAQSNLVDDQVWGISVTCPQGAGETTVTPEVICVS